MRIAGRVAAVIVAAALVAACGSGGEASLTVGLPEASDDGNATPTETRPVAPPASGLGRPACDVLSADEVAQILGNPVRPGTGDEKFCFWGQATDGGTNANVTILRPAAGHGANECATQRNSLPASAQHDSVSGVANSAVWAWQQVAVLLQGTLIACWDDAVVLVRLSGERDQATLRANAVALAQAVRGRI